MFRDYRKAPEGELSRVHPKRDGNGTAAETLHDIVRSLGKPMGRERYTYSFGVVVASLPEHLDEFRCHANNVNWMRYQYKEILAELADSYLLDDLLSQIHGVQGHFTKLSSTLGDKIRESSYALC